MTLDGQVTAILVTYNSGHCLERALASLPTGVASVVVDNGSRDESLAIAGRHATQAIPMHRNTGFSTACNVGAAAASTEFLLMMNPDSEADREALSALLAATERHPLASAFNPVFVRQLEPAQAGNDSQDRIVDTLSGAALFVRKQRFEEVGGFDERFFLYFEDADLSARLARRGPLMQIGGARFLHRIGQSSDLSLGDEFRKYRHYARSRVYFNAKYNTRFNRPREAVAQGLKAVHRLLIGKRRLAAQHLGRAVGYMSSV